MGTIDKLKYLIKSLPIPEEISSIYIIGSLSNNKIGSYSDIDLFGITEKKLSINEHIEFRTFFVNNLIQHFKVFKIGVRFRYRGELPFFCNRMWVWNYDMREAINIYGKEINYIKSFQFKLGAQNVAEIVIENLIEILWYDLLQFAWKRDVEFIRHTIKKSTNYLVHFANVLNLTADKKVPEEKTINEKDVFLLRTVKIHMIKDLVLKIKKSHNPKIYDSVYFPQSLFQTKSFHELNVFLNNSQIRQNNVYSSINFLIKLDEVHLTKPSNDLMLEAVNNMERQRILISTHRKDILTLNKLS